MGPRGPPKMPVLVTVITIVIAVIEKWGSLLPCLEGHRRQLNELQRGSDPSAALSTISLEENDLIPLYFTHRENQARASQSRLRRNQDARTIRETSA